ncbi:MAG TPA: bifunctional 4-hydroxy-2-oxoglutarate aldolase/2-dehydro-3-deoxy-phosphogluconate aldolase [Candidatus Saccharimonadales bacterium]|jgi:2-dehydro-3-deoxyphosphogluconate aldolase/(4S)-4-hydroxy-2-oxoglutarate aldolase|nr:bifunctional 4-hydroxy-2-oxoglutarate aldolase/2-dehydro-3-deoxy-phosphogluconate aldolase [Candidatus Saccharimonadales bacterium]
MNESKIAARLNATEATTNIGRASPFSYPIAATLEKHEVRSCIEDTGIVPRMAVTTLEDAEFVAEALTEGGIPIVEISLNSPDAVEIVTAIVKHATTTIVGAGGVRNVEVARKCADAGVKFLATDGTISGVIEFAAKRNLLTIQGALTLTEVISASDAGADFVKIVPCYAVGGHNYIRTLKATVPEARLIAAGGVNQLTAEKYVMAGAIALGIGQELIPTEAVQLRQNRRIQELARRFLAAVDKGRA